MKQHCKYPPCPRLSDALGYCFAHYRRYVNKKDMSKPILPRRFRNYDVPENKAHCVKCNLVLPVEQFNKRATSKIGLQSFCKSCERDRWLRREYGVSLADWDALFEKQGRICGICKTSDPKYRNWHTDHDHETGVVRGILCNPCNVDLRALDNKDWFKAALEYLEMAGGVGFEPTT